MRKIIQFQTVPNDGGDSSLVVLCDDGTLHEFATDPETKEKGWSALELPPQSYDEPNPEEG